MSELNPHHQSHYLLKSLYPVSIHNFIIMLNTNNNIQTQTSNTLHNAIIEAGSKDRPPMLTPGNYVQWKSRIKRYIDTKPNHELIQYCLRNPPYELGWIDKEIPISEGIPITRTERFQETYKNVSQEIFDACSNACEMWKAIKRLTKGESINVQDLETNLYWEFRKFTSQDGESLESHYSRFYKMMNELIMNQCKNQELKTVSYHKLYDILKQHQHEVHKIRAERIARVANPLALVPQQQPFYHPQTHPTHYTQNSSSRSQQATTKNRGKVIVNSLQPIYDQEPSMVTKDDETSKDKEIDKLMDLISLSFKTIYKPTNNNLRTSSNTSKANQDNSPMINRSAGYENQRIGNVVVARETVGSTVVQKSRIQCYNCKKFRHVVRECQKQKRAKNAAYHREKMLLCKQKKARIQLNAEQADWRDDTDDDELEDQELKAHYMYMAQLQEVSPDAADSGPIFDDEPLQKVSNDDHYNVFAIESAHPKQSKSVPDTYHIEQDAHNVIIDSLDMSYDRVEIDQNDVDDDLANEQLARRNSREYASQMEIECAKVRGDLLSYKMEYQKSCTKSTQMINDLNQTISEIKDKLSAHQKTISILSQQKEAQINLYKTRKDKELDKVIALENKAKVLDNIVYKTSQSVQTMNMLNNKCRTSFAKPEFLKKAQRANPRLYDIERSRLSHTSINNGNSKESFNKQTTLLEKRMDESILLNKKCQSSKEIFKVKTYVNTIINGVELCKEKITNRTYSGYIDPFIQNTIEANFSPVISRINASLEQFHRCLNKEMVVDLRYFNSLELEVESLRSQLETQKTLFLNEINRLSREYYYVDHMNAILGVYIQLDEVTNLQCDYLELLDKCECLETELSESKMLSKSFESIQKHAINLELELQQCKKDQK
nr:hypothetical protein [Tanacetum cinerariifolium]